MTAPLSRFARGLSAETAFDVLAVAKRLKAQGKDVVELQIGDSPFPSTPHAKAAGDRGHRATDQTHYCPSLGPARRSARPSPRNYRERVRRRRSTAENVVVGPGAKVFEQFFCEAFLDPGDARAGLQPALPDLRPEHRAPRRAAGARPAAAGERSSGPTSNDVERFLQADAAGRRRSS